MSSFVAFRAAATSLRVSKPLVTSCLRQQTRNFRGTACCLKKSKEVPDTEFVFNVKKSAKKTIGKITDERIPHRFVRIASDAREGADSGRGAGLSELTSMQDIMASIEKKKHYVLLVSDTPEPIVKIISRGEEYRQAKEAKKKARANVQQNQEKEVHITWGAAPGDVQTKLDRSRDYLGKGMRVHFIFMHKKGQPIPSKEGMVQRVQGTVDSFADIATEYKPRDHRFSMAACFLKPLPPKPAAQAPAPEAEAPPS